MGHYRTLLGPVLAAQTQLQLQKQFAKRNLSALWGKLASDILVENWEQALIGVNLVRDAIEDPRISETPLKQLESRVWLLHWSLFVYYHIPNGHNALLDVFLGNERYQRAIEMKAPWILRYLAVSAILTKNLHQNSSQNNPTTSSNTGNLRLKELVKLIDQETYSYSDPITNFIRNLYIKCDFDLAEQSLEECAEVLTKDFFFSTGVPLPDQGLLAFQSNDTSKKGLAH